MFTYKLIKDIKRGDVINGVYAKMEVINNDGGELFIYNQLTREFLTLHYKKHQNDWSVPVCMN